jgi:hypothetical protein
MNKFYSARIATSHFILATGLKMMTLDWSAIARIEVEAKPACGQEQ